MRLKSSQKVQTHSEKGCFLSCRDDFFTRLDPKQTSVGSLLASIKSPQTSERNRHRLAQGNRLEYCSSAVGPRVVGQPAELPCAAGLPAARRHALPETLHKLAHIILKFLQIKSFERETIFFSALKIKYFSPVLFHAGKQWVVKRRHRRLPQST